MADSSRRTGFTFGGPAVYRIVVQGCLDEDVSDRLGGMRIEATSEVDQTPVTTLIGRLRDQAELSGVLNALYGLRLPVLEVKKLDSEENRAYKHSDPADD